jgi:hypothetical protein
MGESKLHSVTSEVIPAHFQSPLYFKSTYYQERVREENFYRKAAILLSVDRVDKEFRSRAGTAAAAFNGDVKRARTRSMALVALGKYSAADGVHGMFVSKEQETYLSSLSADALLFYLAFTFVDGTDGLGNGIGRLILNFLQPEVGKVKNCEGERVIGFREDEENAVKWAVHLAEFYEEASNEHQESMNQAMRMYGDYDGIQCGCCDNQWEY